MLRRACVITKARVPGEQNQPVVLTKVSKNTVEIAWPNAVSADTCVRVLKKALGDNWRTYLTDPAGVQGAYQEVATAEYVAVAAEAAGEESFEDALVRSLAAEAASSAEAPVSRGASSSAADPFSQRTPLSEATVATSAATADARSGVNLLALKLEAITAAFRKEQGRYEDLPCAYTVNWAAVLGQGTFGKVYVGTPKSSRDTLARGLWQGGVAIKLMRNKDSGAAPRVLKVDAVVTAEDEVRRHVALGLHPNVVSLVDVGLFLKPRSSTDMLPDQVGANRWTANIGLVFDLYEVDVRQFLRKSAFTQGGMRHVLNSVLEGLRFIHDRGCIHCDLKPANIFMRGSIHLRGCFGKDVLKLQPLGDWDAVAPHQHCMTEFQYQIPNSFEVRGGGGGHSC